jgi:peroxiredoxin
MVVDNGVVKSVNVEQPGAFEVSSAEYMLQHELDRGQLP